MRCTARMDGDAVRIALCAAADAPTATCAIELPAFDTDPPEWIDLLPVGDIRARRHDGRHWTNPDPAAVVTASTQERVDPVVDYHHATETAGAGEDAKAAGWIKELQVQGGAIPARVEWTPAATVALKRRYISPTFTHTRDGRVTRILRAVLTNDPALDLPALARLEHRSMNDPVKNFSSKFGLTEDSDETAVTAAMDKYGKRGKSMAAAVGLAEDASDDDIVAAAKAARGGVVAVAKALGLEETATPDELVAIAKANPPDLGQYVPRAEFDSVAASLKALQDERAETRATAAVDAAIAAGKITPAQREWALSYAKADEAGFGKYVEAAPQIVSPDRNPSPPVADADAPLTDDEKALCTAMDLSEEAYKASRKDLAPRIAPGDGSVAPPTRAQKRAFSQSSTACTGGTLPFAALSRRVASKPTSSAPISRADIRRTSHDRTLAAGPPETPVLVYR